MGFEQENVCRVSSLRIIIEVNNTIDHPYMKYEQYVNYKKSDASNNNTKNTHHIHVLNKF